MVSPLTNPSHRHCCFGDWRKKNLQDHCKTKDKPWSGHAWVLTGYMPYPCYRVRMTHILAIPRRGLTTVCLRFCSVDERWSASSSESLPVTTPTQIEVGSLHASGGATARQSSSSATTRKVDVVGQITFPSTKLHRKAYSTRTCAEHPLETPSGSPGRRSLVHPHPRRGDLTPDKDEVSGVLRSSLRRRGFEFESLRSGCQTHR